MKTKLTEARARDLPAGEYQDEAEPSLRLYVTDTSRTWGLYKWHPIERRPIRKSIGPWPLITVIDARNRARALGLKMLDGVSLARPDSLPLSELVRLYVGWSRTRKLRWPAEAEAILKLSFNDWRDRDASTVTRSDVVERHLKIAMERGPAAAARAIKALSSWYAWAETQGMLALNPAKGVKVAENRVRTRYLTKAEWARVEAVLDQPDWPSWTPVFFRVLAETGARWGSLTAARWEHFDLEARQWRVPSDNSKTGVELSIPLSSHAIELLTAWKPQTEPSPWVFPTTKASTTGHIVEPQFAWERVRVRAGIPDVRIHDLRRTKGVRLVEAGAPITVVASILTHKNPATTARVYAHATPDAVRDWLARV